MIQCYYYQVKSPEIIKKDSRGVRFWEGDTVAFNQSGNVVKGVIEKIVKNEWYPRKDMGNRKEDENKSWLLKFEIHIKNEEGGISKLKNPNSFIII